VTTAHRYRLLVSGVTTAIVILLLALPVAGSAGPGAALVVAAVSVAMAGVPFGIVAYVWSANDRERAQQGVPLLSSSPR